MAHPEPVDLHTISPSSIEPLLAEEALRYAELMHWDFSATARLVRELVATANLEGIALVDAGRVVGYSYYVLEDHKAVIGDAYVIDEYASPATERLLLATTLESIRRQPTVRRVEGQPMMLRYAYTHPRADRYERLLLELPLADTHWPEKLTLPEKLRIDPWSWRYEEDAAEILFRSYRGHPDAEMNDQYRAPGRARTYLRNMVNYPACGAFAPEASYVILGNGGTGPKGFVCSSVCRMPNEGLFVGHVAQLCVIPELRRTGLGRLLLSSALAHFASAGCDVATLTVTAANPGALDLYTSFGFVERTRIQAYVWPLWPF